MGNNNILFRVLWTGKASNTFLEEAKERNMI